MELAKQQEISKNIVQQNDAHSLARQQLAAICCVLMLLPFLLYVLATLLLRSRIRISVARSAVHFCCFILLVAPFSLTGILLFSSSPSLCCDATSCSRSLSLFRPSLHDVVLLLLLLLLLLLPPHI